MDSAEKEKPLPLFRVSMAVMKFAEIEVYAVDGKHARELALAQASLAKVKFQTTPITHRTEVQELVDFRDPSRGSHWLEIDKPSIV